MGDSAAFLSAGGYHHHIGLNTWESRGGHAPPPGIDGPLPLRDSLPGSRDARRRAAPARSRRRSARWRGRSRRERGALSSRPRRQRRRALLGPAAVRVAARRRWLAADGDRAARISPAFAPRACAAGADGRPSSRRAVSRSPTDRATCAVKLIDLRVRLLHLHKVLLDDARAAYELDRGRVASVGHLLQLVINDPWFAWLHALSGLIVRIDEAVERENGATDSPSARRAHRSGRAAADRVGRRRRIPAPLLRSPATPASGRARPRRRPPRIESDAKSRDQRRSDAT